MIFIFLPFLSLLFESVLPGHISNLGFEIEHPHHSLALSYKFTFMVETQHNSTFFLRITFPFPIHTSDPLSQLKAEFYENLNCVDNLKESPNLISIDSSDYYFNFNSWLQPQIFYTMIIKTDSIQSVSGFTSLYPPIEIATLLNYSKNSLVIDQNPSFQSIALKELPPNTLKLSYVITSSAEKYYLVEAIYGITVDITPSMTISTNVKYKLFFQNYQFKFKSCGFPSPSNDTTLAYGSCTLSDDNKIAFITLNTTIVASETFKIPLIIKNPTDINIIDQLICYFYSSENNIIYESGSTDKTFTTKKFFLIQEQKVFIAHNMDIGLSEISLTPLHYGYTFSDKVVYNAIKFSFTLNMQISVNNLGVVLQLNYFETEVILLIGSYSHNLPSKSSFEKVICVPVKDHSNFLTLNCYNVGKLEKEVSYFISLKIAFTQTATNRVPGTISLFTKKESGIQYFSLPSMYTTSLLLKSNTEYNALLNLLEPTSYNYIISTLLNDATIAENLNDLTTNKKNIGVFKSNELQTLIFLISPKSSDWCTTPCDLTNSALYLDMYLGKVFDSNSGLAPKFPNMAIQPSLTIDTANENYNYVKIECERTSHCFGLLGTDDIVATAFGVKNFYIKNFNSLYADSFLADIVFSLGYQSEGRNPVSYFLYNGYIINSAYNINIKLSMINYPFDVLYDSSQFPIMIGLKLIIASEMTSNNNLFKSFQLFFDSYLENFSLNNYSATKNESLYYQIGCSCYPSYGTINCNSFKTDADNRKDSFVQMNRIEINLENGVPNLKEITVYIPVKIVKLGIPYSFYIGFLGNDNTFLNIYRIFGSSLDADSLLSNTLVSPVSDTSIYSNVVTNPIFTIKANVNAQLAYGFIKNNDKLYAGNTLSNFEIIAGNGNIYIISPNDATNKLIGAGFTIASEFDLFSGKKFNFSGNDMQCMSFFYNSNNKPKYVLFCPFEKNVDITTINIIVDTFIVPLQWYLKYNFGVCELVYAWSSNKGQLISKQCENYSIENTNDILAVAESNTYLNKNKTTQFLQFILIPNINLTDITKIKIELKISSNFEILSSSLDNENKCYLTNEIDDYVAKYHIDSTNKVIIINKLVSKSASFPKGNYTLLLENMNTTTLDVSSFNISVSLYYINLDWPIMQSKINMIVPMNNVNPFSIKVYSVDFYFENSLMTILSINLTFSDYVGENSRYVVAFANLVINNSGLQCQVHKTKRGKIYEKIGDFFSSSLQIHFFTKQPSYYGQRNLLVICSGVYFPTLNQVSNISMMFGIIRKGQIMKSSGYSFPRSTNHSFYSCKNAYLLEKLLIYPGLPSYYKLTLKPSNPEIQKLHSGSHIYIVFFRLLPIDLDKRGEFSCYVNGMKQQCYTDQKFIIFNILSEIQMTREKAFIVELHDVDQTLPYQDSKVWVGISLTDPKVITEECLIDEINEKINDAPLFMDVLLLNIMNNTFGGSSKIEIHFKLINSTLEDKNLVIKFPNDFILESNFIETSKVSLMESSIQKNIIKGMDVLARNLIIFFDNSVFAATSQTKSFILIMEGVILPWHIKYLCFQQQFSIYLHNNLSQITAASLDFLNFNKVNFLSCHAECLTCKNSSINGCLSCDNSTFLLDSKCLKGCPDNLKEDQRNRVCRECHYSCKNCTDKTDKDCYECGESRALKILNDSTLIGQCECNKTFNDFGENICKACYNNCATCSGVDAGNCKSCYDDFLLADAKTCQCHDNYYQTSDIKCAKCSNIKCKTCSNLNSSTCLSCIENHIVSPAADCICPSNTSDMGTLPKCYDIKNQNCHYSCSTCIGDRSDQCISCDETKDFLNYTCVCKKGYYEEFSSKQCKKCWRTCSSCKGLMPNDCTSCVSNHSLTLDNSCACSPNYFDLDRLDTCLNLSEPCHKSCSKCVGIEVNQCVQCKGNRSLASGLCPCAKGYYTNSSSDCEECHFRCSNCNSAVNLNCLDCSGNHSYIQHSDGVTKVCACPDINEQKFSDIDRLSSCFPLINNSSCDKSCGTCIGIQMNECASCNSTTRFFDRGLCRCFTGLYETQEYNCSDCHYSCLNCSRYKPNECSACKVNRGDENNMPINGLCKCRKGYIDNLVAECELIPLVNHLEITETAVLSVMASTLFPFLLIGAFGIVWKLVESAQLLSYMLYINIDFPLNYGDFLEKIYSFNLNTLIPNPIEGFLGDDNSTIFQKFVITDQIPPLKFEVRGLTSLFIHNAFIIIIIHGVVWLIYLYLILHERRIVKEREKGRNGLKSEGEINKGREQAKNKEKSVVTRLKETFEWCVILQVIQSFELELYLFIALQFINPSFINFFNIVGFLTSLFALIYSFYWIGRLFVSCFLPIKTDSEIFMRKFDYLFELVKIEKYLQRNYFIISTIRKLLLALILVFCQNTIVQLSLLIILYSNMIGYVVYIKPYKEKIKNVIEFFNELLITCLHVLYLIYFIMELNVEERKIFGWVMIGFLVLILLINLIGILIEVFQNIKKICEAIGKLKFLIKKYLCRIPIDQINELEVGNGFEPAKKEGLQKEKDLSTLRNLQDESDRPSFIQNRDENDNYYERKASEKKEHKNNSINDLKNEEREKRKVTISKKYSNDLKKNPSIKNSPDEEHNTENQDFDRQKSRKSDPNLFRQILSFINKKSSPKNLATSIHHINLEDKNDQSDKNEIPIQNFELQPHINPDPNNKSINKFAAPLRFQRTEVLLSRKDKDPPYKLNKVHKNKFPEKIPKEARHLCSSFVFRNENLVENDEKSILSENDSINQNFTNDEEIFINHTVPSFRVVVLEPEENEKKEIQQKKKMERQFSHSKSSFANVKNNVEEGDPYNNEILNIIDEMDDDEELDIVQEKQLVSKKRVTKMSRIINSVPSKKESKLISTRSLQGMELKSFLKELEKKPNVNTHLKPEKIELVKKKEEYIPFEANTEEIVSPQKKKNKTSSSDQTKPSSLSNYFLDNCQQKIDNSKINDVIFQKVDLTGIVLKETWSKGLDFFFLTEGESVHIVEMNKMEKWVKVRKDDKIGLFHLEDLFLR